MKNKAFAVCLLLLLIAGIVAALLNATDKVATPREAADPEGALTYFIDTVTEKVKTEAEGYDQLGLGGGVDGFRLREVYAGLLPSDFNNVQAYQGSYSEMNGQLYFTGNAASNSAVIERAGMKTLLENLSKRLNISTNTKSDVDRILAEI
jgi:hypothetical protein